MPAQPTIPSSPDLPSSPPSAHSPGADPNWPAEALGVPSPAQTLWTAPSPTQTLGHSSPELPPLPSLLSLGGVPHTPVSSRHQPSDSIYYTASWGSPYDRPPPRFLENSSAQRRISALSSDDLENDSSGIQFGLDHLLPSRLPDNDSPGLRFSLEHLIPSRLPPTDQSLTPTKSSYRQLFAGALSNSEGSEETAKDQPPALSEDWVRQFLTERWVPEQTTGRSSENSSEYDKLSVRSKSSEKRQRSIRRSHKARRDNITLKQEDFWDFFSQGDREKLDKMLASRYADPTVVKKTPAPKLGSPHVPHKSVDSTQPSSPVTEKPLPPAPTTAAGKPAPEMANKPASEPVRVPVKVPAAPRTRKAVAWKNKKCWILLPRDFARGGSNQPPMPLSPSEVADRLRKFEQAGYDTRGFQHWNEVDPEPHVPAHSQACALFPDTFHIQEDRQANALKVRVPRKEEWDAYVGELRERKLRALGVSLGGDDDLIAPSMSRQTSSQYPPLPFSPPLPTSSAASSQLFAQSGVMLPGQFGRGPSPGHVSTRSIASPISSFGNSRASMHMHRHSTFASPAGFPQQQPTPPLPLGLQSWSPQHGFAPFGAVRGGSPALPQNRLDAGVDNRSPVSPFGAKPLQPFSFPQNEDLVAQMQQQQQLTKLQQQQQQLIARPSSTLEEVPEGEEAEDDVVTEIKPQPEIAVPKPRGHRHNISAQLERDVREAEYHLEKAIDKQLDEGGEFSTSGRFDRPPVHAEPAQPVTNGTAWKEPEAAQQPVLHQPQPHSRAHSLAKSIHAQQAAVAPDELVQDMSQEDRSDGVRTNVSELTNPSMEDGNKRAMNGSLQHSRTTSMASAMFNSTSMHSKHTSSSSVSKLNVAAKEFKFNPSASFNPGNFASSGFSFTPSFSRPFGGPAGPPPSINSEPIPGLGTGFNAEAAPFRPGGDAGSAVPSSDFHFLSKGPSFDKGPNFKPDAPVFQPSSTAARTTSIFGNIEWNEKDITKPAKRSKAVPIIRPDETQQSEHEDDGLKEDESGRLTQADGRQKRVRQNEADGDSVPLFAAPTQPLGESTQYPASKQDGLQARELVPGDKENVAPTRNMKEDGEEGQEDVKADNDTLTTANLEEGPFNADVIGEAFDQEKTLQHSPSNSQSDDISSGNTETISQPPVRKHASKGSLSATAKPFVFNPKGSAGFDFGIRVTQPSLSQKVDGDPHRISPPRQVSRSPATTFRPSDDGSYKTAPDRRHVPYPDDESIDYDSFVQPSFNEIDAVMKHLNEEGSDFGVEKDENGWMQSSPRQGSLQTFGQTDLHPTTHLRSDAPSPSPRRLYVAIPDGPNGSASETHNPFSDTRAGIAYESPIHRLNAARDAPVSDWDDIISSDQDERIQSRSRFFDSHVDNLIDGLLQARLGPLEKHMETLQDSLNSLPRRRGRLSRLSSAIDSDADDEDDEPDPFYRGRSPRDRKLEKFKTIVMEALGSQPRDAAPAVDMNVFMEAINELKSSAIVQHNNNNNGGIQRDDIRELVEEALTRQSLAVGMAREDAIVKEKEARIEELERSLHEAKLRIEIEVEARKEAEAREVETRRVSQLTEEESRLLRDTSQDEVQRYRALDEECQELRLRIVAYESAEEDLSQKLSTAESENKALRSHIAALEVSEEGLKSRLSVVSKQTEALEGTLEEYRQSSVKWREELRQANSERESFRKSTEVLRLQTEEAIRIREMMRGKLEKLQQDMVAAANQIAKDKSTWQKQDEEHCKRYEVLSARIEAEARTRERLERELERLESQERDGMKFKVLFEQTQHANARLEETVNALRHEAVEHQKTAEKWEREFREAREAGRAEVQRTRFMMEADIEAANNQVNVVRADLESELSRIRAELDSARMDMDTAKAKHELELEEAADAKKHSLQKATEAKKAALQEQEQSHERHMLKLQQEHDRMIKMEREDKERVEMIFKERLSLAGEKIDHFQDKIAHLEDKLEVAKSAAHAAAQAAQAAKANSSSTPTLPNQGPPERISAQALRESIAVLQEQLQERESRIEDLEQKLSETDSDAPAKLKERDTEIGWLRELLGVRIDDLSDLITALAQPAFDREAVRDAAIRIRTNLQMEQQEKERLVAVANGNGRPTLPTLATLSNFASPRAVQLAAAIGNWRKGRDSALSQSQLSSATTSQTQTPIKSSPPVSASQGFFSGLMTPPTSNLKRTPQPPAAGFPALSLSQRQKGKQPVLSMPEPATPPLLRSAAYDQDAEDGRYSTDGFYDDEESTVDGNPGDRPSFEAFGGTLRA